MQRNLGRPVTAIILGVGCAYLACTPLQAQSVSVLTQSAEIKSSGGEVLARPAAGEQLKRVQRKDAWVQVEFQSRNRTQRGWIHRAHLLPETLSQGQLESLVQAAMKWDEGQALEKRGDLAESLRTRREAVAQFRTLLGDDHMFVAANNHTIAALLWRMGNFAEAEALFREVLKRQEVVLTSKHEDYAMTLSDLATTRLELGDHAQAQELYLRAAEIRKARLGEMHPEYAATLHNLGRLHMELGEYPRAEDFSRQAVEIWKVCGPESEANYASTLMNLGSIYSKLGDKERAMRFCEQAVEMRRRVLGTTHPDYADALHAQAAVYWSQGDDKQAEPLYQQARQVYIDANLTDHPHFAAILGNLGVLYLSTAQYDLAESLFQQARGIEERTIGVNHPDYAVTLQRLATAMAHGTDATRAERLYREAIAIQQRGMAEGHPDLILTWNNLAITEAAAGRTGEAAKSFDQARRAAVAHAATILPGLTEQEHMHYLVDREHIQRLGAALSLNLMQSSNADVARLSADWVVNGKAIAHEALAERGRLTSQLTDPGLRELVTRLQTARQRLAVQAVRGAGPDRQAAHQAELARLRGAEHEASRDLVLRVGQATLRHSWIDLEEVRRKLPKGARLIEMARFPALDYATDLFQPERYGAWIVPAMDQGKVAFVDLGDAAAIDALIGDALRAIQESAGKLTEQGEEPATREANDALARLSQRIWQPIEMQLNETQLGTSTSIILSPDANLWLVPWVALPQSDNSLLIQRCTVSFLNTARDLLRETPDARPTAPVVLADPEYQLANGGQAAGQVRGAAGYAGLIRSPVGLDKVVFDRLPGTRAEATAVAPHLETYAGSPPQLLLGGDASEPAVQAARNPRVLLLSTHGYFLPDTESIQVTTTQHGRGVTTGTIRGRVPVNPLLRCGLALAGANTRNQRGNEAADDGILTGLEIVGMDLRGTELVVLSACETSLGDVRNGEGVAGLRQAFQLAGAEAVVATLWQIPDRDTAIIMGDFFANLAAGQSKAEALRNAQLKRIAERRERNGAAHPLFWAAFTLTGK